MSPSAQPASVANHPERGHCEGLDHSAEGPGPGGSNVPCKEASAVHTTRRGHAAQTCLPLPPRPLTKRVALKWPLPAQPFTGPEPASLRTLPAHRGPGGGGQSEPSIRAPSPWGDGPGAPWPVGSSLLIWKTCPLSGLRPGGRLFPSSSKPDALRRRLPHCARPRRHCVPAQFQNKQPL